MPKVVWFILNSNYLLGTYKSNSFFFFLLKYPSLLTFGYELEKNKINIVNAIF